MVVEKCARGNGCRTQVGSIENDSAVFPWVVNSIFAVEMAVSLVGVPTDRHQQSNKSAYRQMLYPPIPMPTDDPTVLPTSRRRDR